MKKYWWLIAIAIVILLALGGFLYYRFKHKSNSNQSQSTNGATSTSPTTNNNGSKPKPNAAEQITNNQAVNDDNFKAAETAYNEGDYATAANFIGQEIAANPSAVAYNLWGNILRDSGDKETAKAKYEAAISLDATFIVAYTNLATIYQDEGNIDKAKEILNQGLATNPGNEDLQNSLTILEITPHDAN